MPKQNSDMDGSAPDTSPAALLIIDMINDLEFGGGKNMLKSAISIAENIKKLKQEAKRFKVPVIYVNDNFGKWRSDFRKMVDHCLHDGVCGEPVVQLLKPEEDDYFVLKPKHSGFYSTTLDTLLRHLQSEILIITGMAGNNCVLFTANDAYMRDYKLIIPADCVASNTEEENQYALRQVKNTLKADISISTEIDIKKIISAE